MALLMMDPRPFGQQRVARVRAAMWTFAHSERPTNRSTFPSRDPGTSTLLGRWSWLAVVFLLGSSAWGEGRASAQPAVRSSLDAGRNPISALDIQDLERAEARLRRHVAYIVANRPTSEDQPLEPATVDGWAVVAGPRKLVCQAFLVKDAESVKVRGPKGSLTATVTGITLELRVAHLETEAALASIGLEPSEASPKEARKVGMDVFALVATTPGAGVLAGTLTDLGEAPHLEGNLRSDLHLARGMPVFDAHVRWLGIARAVAWDRDRAMLIPPELTMNVPPANNTPKVEEATPPKAPGAWWAPNAFPSGMNEWRRDPDEPEPLRENNDPTSWP